jgi:DNA-directed RNA polymerase subunit M/transcription elongation factor TFIIS
MRIINEPVKFRTEIVKKLENLVNDTHISSNLEISIYNYTIKKAAELDLVKKWTNKFFVQLYLDRLFSIQSNLKNPLFKGRLISRDIKISEYILLTHQTMLPEKWSDAIKKKKERDENKYNPVLTASTEDFTCYKCGSNKCIHFQAQTRSADEAMTTYVTCISCGENWKC